jgi:hypothetical protein
MGQTGMDAKPVGSLVGQRFGAIRSSLRGCQRRTGAKLAGMKWGPLAAFSGDKAWEDGKSVVATRGELAGRSWVGGEVGRRPTKGIADGHGGCPNNASQNGKRNKDTMREGRGATDERGETMILPQDTIPLLPMPVGGMLAI